MSFSFIEDYNAPVDELVEERSFEGFFPSARELAEASGKPPADPDVVSESKRWRRLEALLRKRLRDIRLFRVGKVQIRCYIAGVDEHGDISGLVTTSIET